MAEQSNIFKKLDEIKSGIDEIKAPVQDETKLKEFIANAERGICVLRSEIGVHIRQKIRMCEPHSYRYPFVDQCNCYGVSYNNLQR